MSPFSSNDVSSIMAKVEMPKKSIYKCETILPYLYGNFYLLALRSIARGSSNDKKFPYHMSIFFTLAEWMFLPISTFAIIKSKFFPQS